MFASRLFPGRYFARRYWPAVGAGGGGPAAPGAHIEGRIKAPPKLLGYTRVEPKLIGQIHLRPMITGIAGPGIQADFAIHYEFMLGDVYAGLYGDQYFGLIL